MNEETNEAITVKRVTVSFESKTANVYFGRGRFGREAHVVVKNFDPPGDQPESVVHRKAIEAAMAILQEIVDTHPAQESPDQS